MDKTLWGIHMPEWLGERAIDEGFVAIGWYELDDLSKIGLSRELLKENIAETYPDRKQGAYPVWAGVLYRFVSEMEIGDYVLFPSKHNRAVNIGVIESVYEFHPIDDWEEYDVEDYPNRRKVNWLGSYPRNEFTQSALNEIGSAITLFKIRNHKSEFLAKIGETSDPGDEEIAADDDLATQTVANLAEDTAKDFILKKLHSRLTGFEFEHFVAHLLECSGYTARTTEPTSDGGVDVIAHRDKLGFEPPIIKVQCKRSFNQIEEKQIRDLAGTLGDGEYGLFVTLGTYSKPARVFERNKPKIRLFDGEQLVMQILQNYGNLSPRYRTMIPLKQIYIPDILES